MFGIRLPKQYAGKKGRFVMEENNNYIEKFVKQFTERKSRVCIFIFGVISAICSFLFIAETHLAVIPIIFTMCILGASILNIIYSVDINSKIKYNNDMIIIGIALSLIGFILRTIQLGIAFSVQYFIAYFLFAVAFILLAVKLGRNRGSEKVIIVLLVLLTLYDIFEFFHATSLVKGFFWKLYHFSEAFLFLDYIAVLLLNKNAYEEFSDKVGKYKVQIPSSGICIVILTIIAIISIGVGTIKNFDSTDILNRVTEQASLNNDSADKKENETTKKTDKKNNQDVFSVSEDLKVCFAYSYDNSAYIVVENTSDKAILDYKVAYITFDKNGFSTVTDRKYETGQVTGANLLPNQKNICSFSDYSGAYPVAVVSNISYQNGEEWTAIGLDDWADSTTSNFTVDSYKQSINSLSEAAKMAENNEHLKIVSSRKFHDNRFSNQDDFSFTLENISNQSIVSAQLKVLEYDDNGFAVTTAPYDKYAKNDKSTGGTINLTVGSRGTFTDNLFFVNTCSKYKCIISSIEFADGTEWTNPYLYEWIIVNCNNYIENNIENSVATTTL